MNSVSVLGVCFIFVVRPAFTQELSCEEKVIKSELYNNCGNGNRECHCTDHTARCVGNMSTTIIPELRKNITELHIECYNLAVLNRSSFVNIERLHLTKISLQQNEIGSISEDLFSAFVYLSSVEIENNENINHTSLFIALGSIQKTLPLSLALNRIGLRNINETCFQYLNRSNVESLALDGNIIEKMNFTVLQALTSLQNLSLRSNWIKDTNENDYLENLVHLDLSNNHLTKDINFCTENGDSFYPNLKLLYLVKNRIGTIEQELSKHWECLKSLEYLNLSDNSIKIVYISLFSNLSSLETLILSSNWINEVKVGKFPDRLQKIDFRRNEFVVFPPKLCDDGKNSTFPSIRSLNFRRNYIQKLMMDNFSCLTGLLVLDFSKNDVRELKNNTFANLKGLKHLYLDNMIPWLKTIEPAAFNSTSLQSLSLRFNWIDFTVPQAVHIFRFCPNIKWLDISYNYFMNMDESRIVEILSPMVGLQHLKAQRISLKEMPSEILLHFKNLSYLNINRNLLTAMRFPESFKNDSIQLSIQNISMAEGIIHSIDIHSFPSSLQKSLKELDLSDNAFACDCENEWFRNNIVNGRIENIKLLRWPEGYVCRSPTKLEGKPFKNYEIDEQCHKMKPIIVALIAVACSFFVFSTLFATAYWNRWYVQYYWYKISRRRREDMLKDSESVPLLNQIRFDGYVVYNSKDDSFVHHTFRNYMEGQLGYKLHIWERNATSGALVDVILDAIYASKHVVVIVSDNLMKDPWCKFQVDVAIDRSIDMRENCVLLVVLEDVEYKSISKSWCVLLTKTRTAHWSNCEQANAIKRKYFEEIIKKQFGTPISE